MKEWIKRLVITWIYSLLSLLDFFIIVITFTIVRPSIGMSFINWVSIREVKKQLKAILGADVKFEVTEVTEDEDSKVDGQGGQPETVGSPEVPVV